MAGRGRKVAVGLAIGCLGVPMLLALIIGGMLLTGKMVSDKEGSRNPERYVVSVPTTPPSYRDAAGAGEARDDEGTPGGTVTPGTDLPEFAPRTYTAERPLRLTVEMEEGRFRIEPGPPGSAVRAEGYYDDRDYELTQEVVEEGDLGRHVTIRFRRTRPWFVILFFGEENRNEVTVSIPEGVPTALMLRLSKGESDVELGGLTLTDLHANLGMGEHELGLRHPLTHDLERTVIHGGMGEIRLHGMGNARAREYDIRGSMGEFTVDFDGEWTPGFTSHATVRFKMGECRISVPSEVRIPESSSASVILGEVSTPAFGGRQPEDPDAPTLEFDVSASMGGVFVNR